MLYTTDSMLHYYPTTQESVFSDRSNYYFIDSMEERRSVAESPSLESIAGFPEALPMLCSSPRSLVLTRSSRGAFRTSHKASPGLSSSVPASRVSARPMGRIPGVLPYIQGANRPLPYGVQ